jgi:hypothetical protein
MPQAPGENPTAFADTITFDQPMTRQDAINALATFHGVPEENVLAAFLNLRQAASDCKVVFQKGSANGWNIVNMKGRYPDGRFAWNHRIDWHTGQPIMTTG